MPDEGTTDSTHTETVPDDVQHFKKIIGDQGNEIGTLRRLATEAQARNDQLAAQMAAIQQAQQNAGTQTIDLFSGIPVDQQFMSPSERGRMNDLFVRLATATEANIRRATEDTKYSLLKAHKGISDTDEKMVLSEVPSLAGLAPEDRIKVIADIAESRRLKSPEGRSRMVADESARLSARRESFVESSDRVAAEPESERQKVEARLMAGSYKNAAEMEKDLQKLGFASMEAALMSVLKGDANIG